MSAINGAVKRSFSQTGLGGDKASKRINFDKSCFPKLLDILFTCANDNTVAIQPLFYGFKNASLFLREIASSSKPDAASICLSILKFQKDWASYEKVSEYIAANSTNNNMGLISVVDGYFKSINECMEDQEICNLIKNQLDGPIIKYLTYNLIVKRARQIIGEKKIDWLQILPSEITHRICDELDVGSLRSLMQICKSLRAIQITRIIKGINSEMDMKGFRIQSINQLAYLLNEKCSEIEILDIESTFSKRFDKDLLPKGFINKLNEEFTAIKVLKTVVKVPGAQLNALKEHSNIHTVYFGSVDTCAFLKKCKNVKSINIGYISKGICRLVDTNNLQHLRIGNGGKIVDLSLLKVSESLESLEIGGTTLTDLSFLSRQTKLKKLTLSGSCNNEQLPYCPSLEYLDISRVDSQTVDLINWKNWPNFKGKFISKTHVIEGTLTYGLLNGDGTYKIFDQEYSGFFSEGKLERGKMVLKSIVTYKENVIGMLEGVFSYEENKTLCKGTFTDSNKLVAEGVFNCQDMWQICKNQFFRDKHYSS